MNHHTYTDGLSEEQKRRIRRGFYDIHRRSITDTELKQMTLSSANHYRAKAKQMERRDKWSDAGAWLLGIAFYGGMALFAFWGVTSGSDNSSSSPSSSSDSSYSAPASSSYEPSYSDYEEDEPEDEGCDSGYSGCVEDVSYDLDCADIGETVDVYGSDPHGLDGDGDGVGCESY